MPTLESAITEAVETHKGDLPGSDEQVPVVETKEETTVEVEDSVVKEKVVEPLDQDAENGRILVQALRDPYKAALVIDHLARTNGYTKGEVQTKVEVKEAKADITKMLEEELGDELKFIAPKLGKALDKYFESMKVETTNPELENLRGRVEKTERREIEAEIGAVHNAISQEYFQTDEMPVEVAQALSKAMDEFPPSEGMNPSTYYRRMFNFVAGERGLTKQSVKQGERAARNKADAPARQLAATNRGVTPNVNGDGARKMSLGDAVTKAIAEINEKSGKS